MFVKRLGKAGLVACILCAGATSAQAQDWKSILSGIANTVTEKVTGVSTFSLEGTWTYAGPDCKFESDNVLAKVGSEIAAQKVETEITNILSKIGFKEGVTYRFNADGTYSSTVNGRTTQGTYTYDSETNELALKTKLGYTFNATVSKSIENSNKISLLFNADKLMSLAQTVSSALKSSATSTLSTILGQYDGMKIGFELTKQ